jgi:hypothetical protein
MSSLKNRKQSPEHIAKRVAATRTMGQYDRVGDQVRRLRKNKTLEELYGRERAIEIREQNRLKHVGKVYTQETQTKKSISINKTNDRKRALGIPLRSDEDRKNSSERMTNNNPMKNPEIAKRAGENKKKNFKENPKMGENLSMAMVKRILEGKRYGSYGIKGKFYSDKNQKEMLYRSSWECDLMKFLENSSDIERYEYETLVLPYRTVDGKLHHSIPDFLVYYKNGLKELIEVKPQFKIDGNYDNTVLKLQTYQDWAEQNGFDFQVATETTINLINNR